MFHLGITQIDNPKHLGYVNNMAKAHNGPMSVEQKRDKQGNLLSLGNSLRGFLQAPRSNMIHSFPVTVENMPPKENQKIQFLL